MPDPVFRLACELGKFQRLFHVRCVEDKTQYIRENRSLAGVPGVRDLAMLPAGSGALAALSVLHAPALDAKNLPANYSMNSP